MELIEIKPNNKEIQVAAETVKLKNEFLTLGYKTRTSFIEIVQSLDNYFSLYSRIKSLELFWILRSKDEELNKRLQKVLLKLEKQQ